MLVNTHSQCLLLKSHGRSHLRGTSLESPVRSTALIILGALQRGGDLWPHMDDSPAADAPSGSASTFHRPSSPSLSGARRHFSGVGDGLDSLTHGWPPEADGTSLCRLAGWSVHGAGRSTWTRGSCLEGLQSSTPSSSCGIVRGAHCGLFALQLSAGGL